MNRFHHSKSSGSPQRQKDREIARLRSELATERSRSAKLERKVTALKRELKEHDLTYAEEPIRRVTRRVRNRRREELLLDKSRRNVRYYRKSSFPRYLLDSLRESAFIQILSKFRRYLKRFQLVQTVIPILLAAGAAVAVAIVSPLALLILSVCILLPVLITCLCFRRATRMLKRELGGRRVRILIPQRREAMIEGSFFLRNARAMAAGDRGVTVIIVTPHALSRRGPGKRKRKHFLTARKEADGLYVVRRHYFFTLRRKVLDPLDADVTVMY